MPIVEADLQKYDFVLAIDASGSMGDPNSASSNQSRWKAAEESAIALAREVGKFDDDGIDVIIFSGSVSHYQGVNEDKVRQIFREKSPMGSTNTAAAIRTAWQKRKAKPVIMQIITDGEPDSQREVIDEIVKISNQLQRDEEFSIQFIQYGDNAGATKFLQYLDDNLVSQHKAKFDIVDTVPNHELGNQTIVELLLKAVND